MATSYRAPHDRQEEANADVFTIRSVKDGRLMVQDTMTEIRPMTREEIEARFGQPVPDVIRARQDQDVIDRPAPAAAPTAAANDALPVVAKAQPARDRSGSIISRIGIALLSLGIVAAGGALASTRLSVPDAPPVAANTEAVPAGNVAPAPAPAEAVEEVRTPTVVIAAPPVAAAPPMTATAATAAAPKPVALTPRAPTEIADPAKPGGGMAITPKAARHVEAASKPVAPPPVAAAPKPEPPHAPAPMDPDLERAARTAAKANAQLDNSLR